MSHCNDCDKTFASRQSLSNHRKRLHPNKKVQNEGQRFSDSFHKSEVEDEEKNAYKVINLLKSGESTGKRIKTSPTVDKIGESSSSAGKKIKVSNVASKIDKILGPSKEKHNISESSSETDEDSDSESDVKDPIDKKKQDSLLTNVFKKLYSDFDENDIEMCNDILRLLDALKERGCIKDREYIDIKSQLERKIDLNLYESINSTVDNMIKDDKEEVLGLLRSMEKDKEAQKLIAQIKDYFEKEMELESVLPLLPNLKDKLNAMRVRIILKQIQKTRDRVNKIFTLITNGSDKEEILNDLRAANDITDEQYDKLLIGPHTLPSISRIVQGKGLYLRKHW